MKSSLLALAFLLAADLGRNDFIFPSAACLLKQVLVQASNLLRTTMSHPPLVEEVVKILLPNRDGCKLQQGQKFSFLLSGLLAQLLNL